MKLKNIIVGVLWITTAMISCKKDTEVSDVGGYIKSFGSDSNMVVVGNIPQGNNIIIVCRTMNELGVGTMYKMDFQGNILWEKPVPAENRVLWQVYDLPGSGFATVGYGDVSRSEIVICFYNDDADFLYSRQVPWKTSWGPSDIGPVQMLQLSTGGYVFTASVAYNYTYAVFTNSNIDTLTRVEKVLSVPGNFSWGYVVSPRGICEMPDSTVMISVAFSPQIVNPNNYASAFRWQTLVYRLDFTGQVKSLTQMGDSLHNETPSALLKMGSDVLIVTGRMGQTHDGSGVFVNYLNNQMGFLCSGEINLLRVSSLGNLISRNALRDYTANGLILNARPTNDGGYIVCGTVNQSTSLSTISPTKIYIMKVNSSGSYEWSRTFVTTYPSYGVDAVQMPDGGYFVTGYQKTFDKKFNALVIKTDANGNI